MPLFVSLVCLFMCVCVCCFEQLSSKLDCDEDELIAHAKELVEELTTKLHIGSNEMEEEGMECKDREGSKCDDEETDYMES